MKLNQDKIKDVISGILQARKALKEKIEEAQNRLRACAGRAQKVRVLLKNFQEGLSEHAAKEPQVAEVVAGCTGFISAVGKIADKCTVERSRLHNVLTHFERDSFCVASAGGSQAGKSTTLQKIVGFDGSDPHCPVVGGGTGNSTTATRCRIVNIGSQGESHAEIEFYSKEEFFARIVLPYYDALKTALPLPAMSTIDDFIDFECMDFEQRHSEALKILGGQEQLKKIYVRFCALRKAYDEYCEMLDEPMRNVSLNNAYEYLVYPSAKPQYNCLRALCYAVKEVTLFCQYPNPVVDQIEFFDLPGAGEVAPDVEKRYVEGFDLKTDIVVYVGRYDGRIFGNEDVAMVDGLSKVVPLGQLENFMIYFQNDFGQVPGDMNKLVRVAEINKGSRRDAYAILGKTPDIRVYKIPAGIASTELGDDIQQYVVSDIGEDGFVVVFGKGNDAEYVSQTLLPLICHFASKRMVFLDAALVEGACKRVEGVEYEFESIVKSIKDFLLGKNKGIPSDQVGFTTNVNRRVRSLRTALGTIRKEIEVNYQNGVLMSPEGSSLQTAASIQEQLSEEISKENSGLFLELNREGVLRELRHSEDQSSGRPGQLMCYLRNLRVTITERYAQLEHVYLGSIQDVEDLIFKRIRAVDDEDKGAGVAFLNVTDGAGLENWIKLLEDAGCEGMVSAARDLQALEVSFYLSVYPDIRKRVFSSSVEDVYKRDFAVVGSESVEACYAILRDLADRWAYEVRECIEDRNVAREIVFSAIDRFFERTLYSSSSDEELRAFVSFYWDEFSAGKKSPLQICKSRIEAVLKEISKIEGSVQ